MYFSACSRTLRSWASSRSPPAISARSKRGNILKRFEQLCYWVREELPVQEAILDGEVVALDSEGRQNFRDLLAGRGNLHYAAFDALWVRGRDLRGLPLTRRSEL
jgi:ATP-dependent DNA ligase